MTIQLYQAEALNFLTRCRCHYDYDLVFMDPPDNIKLKYEGYDDNRKDYYSWLEHLILKSMFLAPVVWVSYYHKHDLKVKAMVNWIINTIKPSWEARTFIWRFTFGQYRTTDCGSGYRPILRLSKPGVRWNTDEIKIISKRQLLGDPRSKGPRVPDDVWEFPRVVGNSPERRAWIPTQHPEALLERIVKMSLENRQFYNKLVAVKPTYRAQDGIDTTPVMLSPGKFEVKGQKVLELFSGSGTMIRVAKRLGFDLDTVDLNVCKLIEEHPDIGVGD